jgi:hypothetical protein
MYDVAPFSSVVYSHAHCLREYRQWLPESEKNERKYLQ